MTLASTYDPICTVVCFLAAWLVASVPVALVVARAIALMGHNPGVPEGEYRDRDGWLAEVKS